MNRVNRVIHPIFIHLSILARFTPYTFHDSRSHLISVPKGKDKMRESGKGREM